MPINSFLYPGVKVFTPYEVANSLRFDDGSSDYLQISSSSGSNTTGTFSAWIKRGNLSSTQCPIGVAVDGNNFINIQFNSSNQLNLRWYDDGSPDANYNTTAVFRDVSAWYHVVMAFDTTQSTSSDRVKVYVNNTLHTLSGYPPQNNTIMFNTGSATLQVGSSGFANSFLDGYMAEVCWIDGTALDPTSFGETDEDTGIWKPIDVSGLTFGTNGFYLDFENSGSLGADVSGNGNNFTVNNLTSIDQTTDTCTNNFCTMSPLTSTQNFNLSEGNLKLGAAADNKDLAGTIAGTIDNTNSGYYYEYKVNASNLGSSGEGFRVGILNVNDIMITSTSARVLQMTQTDLIYETATNGGASATDTNIGSASNGDIVMVAWKNGKVWFGVNGTFVNSGNPSAGTGEQFSGLSGDYIPWIMCSLTNGVNGSQFNFGNPTFSISSGNADANGYGNFEYAPPTGFYALCTKNLAEYG